MYKILDTATAPNAKLWDVTLYFFFYLVYFFIMKAVFWSLNVLVKVTSFDVREEFVSNADLLNMALKHHLLLK